MKRLLAILITCVLVGSLAACGSAGGSTESNASSAPSEEAGSQAADADNKTTPEQTDGSVTETSADNADGSHSKGSRILVVYFSRTGEQYTVGVIDHGNTAIVSEMIADETGADLFEILDI